METVFGKHSVKAVFLARPQDIKKVWLLASQKENLQEFADLAHAHQLTPEYLPWPKFLKASQLTQAEKHQGVCILARPREELIENDLEQLADARLVLALDTISNPQNLASIIRTAAFFKIDAILTIKNRNAAVTPEVTRIAVGGAEFVKIFHITNLARSLKTLKKMGFWVYGMDEAGEKTMAETEFDDKTVLVIGAEGQGLRQNTRDKLDFMVRIAGGREGLESLNAAIATSIALYELNRK